MTNKGGIYSITNTENQKQYIGSSLNIAKRKNEHFSTLKNETHGNRHLQSAFRKYGENSFVFKIVLVCEKSDLIYYEQKVLDLIKPEYNICKNANNTLGVIRTKETRENISRSQLERFSKPEEIEKLRQSHLGHVSTEEQKRKISESLKGKPRSKEVREKLRLANIGRVISVETREKMSKAKLGIPLSLDHRNKIAESNKGKKKGKLDE